MPRDFKANLQLRAVARALAAWREESGLSLAEVSKASHWSTCKTSFMENAVSPISECDVLTLALVYKVDAERREPVYRGAQRARDPRAVDLASDHAAPCIGWTYAEVEAEASHLRITAVDTLPHLVRTREYTDAMRAAQAVEASRPYGDELRARVQTHLRDGPSLRADLVVAEAVLRRPVGGTQVMADQLVRLMELSELGTVSVRVVPDKVGAFAGMGSPFTILYFREDRFDDVAYVENLHGCAWLESGRTREPYEQTFAKLADVALPAEDSLALIADAVHRLQVS